MLDDRSDDGVPVGRVDAVAGSVQQEQPCPGYLGRQCFAVARREHRIRRAMDDKCRGGDRGEGAYERSLSGMAS